MTRGTRVLVVTFETIAMLLIARVLVPPALDECRAARAELATRRQDEQVRKSLKSQEAAIREVHGRMRELLRDSGPFGLLPHDSLMQELSTVVNLAGLKFQRFNHGEVRPVGAKEEDMGECRHCSLEVQGDYPTILRFLLLQRERLPCLRLVELKAQRALRPTLPTPPLSFTVAFAAPILGQPLTQPATGGEPTTSGEDE